jgi:fatty acid desaturase
VILSVAWINIAYPSIFLYLPSIWIIGAFQFALGESMLHEAAHGNLFEQKKLNYRLQFLYALPFFRTVNQFRKEHITHHNQLNKKGDQLVEDYAELGLLQPGINYFFTWFIKPVIGFAGFYYVSAITLKPFKKEGWKILAFWAIVVLAFGLAGKLIWLLQFWIIPLVWSCYSYLYWSEISDHFHTHTGTRSNINPVTNFITHNNGYHYVHHQYPTIPWFRLKKAHYELCNAPGDISTGFVATYRQIVRYPQPEQR